MICSLLSLLPLLRFWISSSKYNNSLYFQYSPIVLCSTPEEIEVHSLAFIVGIISFVTFFSRNKFPTILKYELSFLYGFSGCYSMTCSKKVYISVFNCWLMISLINVCPLVLIVSQRNIEHTKGSVCTIINKVYETKMYQSQFAKDTVNNRINLLLPPDWRLSNIKFYKQQNHHH